MILPKKQSIGRITLICFFTALFILSTTSIISQGKKTNSKIKSLTSSINKILNDTLLQSSFIGIDIVRVEDGKHLYSLNSEKLFHPASNLKLITSAAALHYLKSDYEFKTEFSTNGDTLHGILNGNIYVKASGDPLISEADIDSIVSVIKDNNVSKITGDIIGNVSCFDTVYWGHGWMWDDEPSADQPFITPLCLNKNSITVHISSGSHSGDSLLITIEPVTSYINISNTGITSADTLLPPLNVTRKSGSNLIQISGRAPENFSKDFQLSVWKPEFYFLNVFKERLIENGISVGGLIRIDSIPGLNSIAEIVHPLDSVIYQINKMSDNLAAENMLKTLPFVLHGTTGNTNDGLKMVKNYFLSSGIDTNKTIIVDGSGISWYNEVSPSVITKLLLQEYHDKNTFNSFYESLPIASVDGTLKHRMIHTKASGNVRAKTGTLTGVSGISGYVKTLNGKLLAFSILLNHYHGEVVDLRDIQDKILELLASSEI